VKRKLCALACAGLVVVAAGGCSTDKKDSRPKVAQTPATTTSTTAAPATAPAGSTAPSTPTTPPPPPPPLVTAAKINAILLPLDEVGKIVGAPLGYERKTTTPSAPINVTGDKSACAVLFGLDSNAFGKDNNWQAFRNDRQQDSEQTVDHLVYQRVAIYNTTDEPGKLLHGAFDPTAVCNNAVVHSSANDANTDWQFQGPTVTADRAQWTESEQVSGKPNGWYCGHDVRVKNNVLFEAQVCQFADPPQVGQLATTIADRMTNWFPA
jgi:hypothetical protein